MKEKGRRSGKVKDVRRASGGEPTPIYVSRRALVVSGVVGVFALAFMLYAAPTIPTVAFGGVTLALVLSYPVDALSRVMPRGLAILLTVVALVGAVVLAFVFLAPLLGRQLTNFFQITPQIADSANDLIRNGIDFLDRADLPVAVPDDFASNVVDDLFSRAQELLQSVVRGLFGVVSSAFNLGITVFGILFVAIYLLVDVRKIEAAYLKASPHRYRRDARELWDAFGVSLSRYLGGLLFVVVVQGVLSGAALYLLSVPYFILLGLWVSLTAVIPYLGAFLGAIPAIIIALLFTTPTTAVLVVIVYIAIQQLEGNFLTPRLQGRAVRVHPIIVLLAVIGGGQLAGLAGVIFAVPALAVAKVLMDFLRVRIRPKEDASPRDGTSNTG